MTPDLVKIPAIALSVRQPWAWALIFAGKDNENRDWPHVDRLSVPRRRIAVHAAKGMTQAEYAEGRDFMEAIGVRCPEPDRLQRGGVIGAVTITDFVSRSDSKWFQGPKALVVRDPVPCAFAGAVGALGFFRWKPNGAKPDEPARWMVQRPQLLARPTTGDLFA